MQAAALTASWRITIIALIASLSANGCSSTEGQNTFYIARAINLVTDSPTQVVEIGELSFQVAFASGVGYSSAFAASGSIEVRGFVPGANPGDAFDDTLVLKPAENVDFEDSTAYTVVNYGTVADFRSLTVINPILDVVDQNSNVVQFIHAALGAGSVDVYVTDPDADIAGATPLFSLSAGQVGAQQSLAFAPHRVRITTMGTMDVVFDSGTIDPVVPGRLVYLIGKSVGPNQSPIFLNQWYNQGASSAIADTNSPAFVRLLHLSPDFGALDLFAEDDYTMPVASNLDFREISAYSAATDTLPDGPAVFENSVTEFLAGATDAEDGDLTEALSWASSIDGPLEGAGASISATLSPGDHAVTASVTDSGGLTGTDAITVRVLSADIAAPVVSITRPPSRTSIASGAPLTLTATAIDESDGDLTEAISWTSSIDGLLPDMGGSTTVTLSAGVHAMTASVSDSSSIVGSDTIIVLVDTDANAAPDVAITAPDVTGAIEFDVTLAGDPDSVLLQSTQQALNGTAYTFVVAGDSSDLTGTLIADAIQSVATHNLLRVVHASSLLATLDVYLTAPGVGISGTSPIIAGVVPAGFSGYSSIPGGPYDVTLTDSGTSNVVLTIPSLTLSNGVINTLALVEEMGATSPDYRLFVD